MSVTIARTPPADGSGGFIVMRAKTAEEIVHTMRFHVCNFNPGDLTYTPSTPQGTTTEATVTDTAVALIPFLHAYYPAGWDVRWLGLWRNQGGGVLRRLHVPNPVHHSGTNSAPLTNVEYVLRRILTFESVNDEPYRVTLTGISGGAISSEDWVTATTGGTAEDNALVGYLTGTDTAVRAHDGHSLTVPAHATTTVSMRARRKGMRAA